MEAHTEKMTRWTKDAVEALKDPIFCILLRVEDKLVDPYQHFMHFIQQRRDDSVPKALAELVWGKAFEIEGDIVALNNASVWSTILDATPLQYAPRLESCLHAICLQLHANYKWRVIDVITSSNVQMLWFGYGNARDEIPDRMRIARRLLYIPEDTQLHASCRKIVGLFRRELMYVLENDGAVPMTLYSIFRIAAVMWKCDTQEIEGYNNMLQHVIARAPSISLDLLDACCALRKDLHLGSRHERCTRYSRISHRVDAIVDEASENFVGITSIVTQPDRWAIPPPVVPIAGYSNNDFISKVGFHDIFTFQSLESTCVCIYVYDLEVHTHITFNELHN